MFSTSDTGLDADPTLIVGMKVLYLDEVAPTLKNSMDSEATGVVIGELKKLFNVNPVKMRDGRMAFLFLCDKEGKVWPTTGRFDAAIFGESQ